MEKNGGRKTQKIRCNYFTVATFCATVDFGAFGECGRKENLLWQQ